MFASTSLLTANNENYHSYGCWINPAEYKQLKQTAGSYRDSLMIQLGGEFGLRSFEIPQIRPEYVRHVDGHARLRVPEGKDTEESGGKLRDTYLPEHVESELLRFANIKAIDRDESLIDLSDRSFQRRVNYPTILRLGAMAPLARGGKGFRVDSRSMPQQRQGACIPHSRSASRDSSARLRVCLRLLRFADAGDTAS